MFHCEQETSQEGASNHPAGYCEDKGCWCHFDVGYHEQVTEMPEQVSQEDYLQALSFFGVVNGR